MADKPSVVLSFNPSGPVFSIPEQCEMPNIAVQAAFKNITPDPKIPLQFQWNVSLVFNGMGCPHSLGRVVKHPDINQVTATNTFKIPFTAVRGGSLRVSVKVVVNNTQLSATSENLQITGTNPSPGTLGAFANANTAFRKLMRVESRLRQFLKPEWPYFSEDDRGGIGICQLTDAPTDDQVWSWKANVQAGWAVYQGKETIARNHSRNFRNGSDFHKLSKAYNDLRYDKAKKAALAAVPVTVPASAPAAPPKEVPRQDLAITIPDYTDEQLEYDTIRGYNGYADGMYEYRALLDKDGILVLTVDEPNLKGTASWERITGAMRLAQFEADDFPVKKRGDPSYVDDVLAMPSF
jgi:hypothetical protein